MIKRGWLAMWQLSNTGSKLVAARFGTNFIATPGISPGPFGKSARRQNHVPLGASFNARFLHRNVLLHSDQRIVYIGKTPTDRFLFLEC